MKKASNLKKGLLGVVLGGGILLGTGYKVNQHLTGTTWQDYFGGTNIAKVYQNGEEKEMTIPVYPIWETRPNRCSLYARLVTESMGNKINRGNAWDLPKNNENHEYPSEKLSKGDIVGFYNPKSAYNSEEREYSHVAVYLGKNKDGEEIYAEQRGMNSRITSLNEFEKEGWTPKRIIKVKGPNEK